MSSDLERRRVRIAGRVQGVGFRATTLEEARQLGVTGWVRNLPDDRVEAVLEAPGAALRQMLDYCHRGPSWARVDHVDVAEETPEGFQGFEIR